MVKGIQVCLIRESTNFRYFNEIVKSHWRISKEKVIFDHTLAVGTRHSLVKGIQCSFAKIVVSFSTHSRFQGHAGARVWSDSGFMDANKCHVATPMYSRFFRSRLCTIMFNFELSLSPFHHDLMLKLLRT